MNPHLTPKCPPSQNQTYSILIHTEDHGVKNGQACRELGLLLGTGMSTPGFPGEKNSAVLQRHTPSLVLPTGKQPWQPFPHRQKEENLLAAKRRKEASTTLCPRAQSLTWCNAPADKAGTMVARSGAGSGPEGRGCRHWGLCMSPTHSTSSSRCLNWKKKARIRFMSIDINPCAQQGRSLPWVQMGCHATIPARQS